jgi:transposase
VLKRLARGGLRKGKTIGVDSTTLEANAAMKSIVRRNTQEATASIWSDWPKSKA